MQRPGMFITGNIYEGKSNAVDPRNQRNDG